MTKLENGVDVRTYKKLENGVGKHEYHEEQYETSNEGQRDWRANNKGGREGKKLADKMKKKYDNKRYSYKRG